MEEKLSHVSFLLLLSGYSTHVYMYIHTCAGTFPLEVPYEDIRPGINTLELYITDSDGRVLYINVPYNLPAGMKEIMRL